MANKDSDKGAADADDAKADGAATPPARAAAVSHEHFGHEEPEAVQLLRKVDGYVGVFELAVLCLFLVVMICAGMWETYAFFTKSNEAKPAELIKYAVFFSALAGAALAAQRQQMISMDIVSRLLSPRTRAWVRVVTTLFAAVMCIFMAYKGWLVYEVKAKGPDESIYISEAKGALGVVIAGLFLTFHFVVHVLVDLIYLLTGKVPPEDTTVKAH